MLKTGRRLGKYRIERRLADGGFSSVFQAMDTIEGIRVALKVPYDALVTKEVLDDFRQEVRLTAKLDHPNILSIKNASFIDDHFVIVFPLGEKTLGDRLRSRISLRTSLDFAHQMLEAVAYAHRYRIIHCDIKPDNFILFPGNHIRLTDFGIAKVAQKTVKASGSGTVGYIAPEQAMGKPSLRSDVFSLGLVLYRMFSGRLPEWPFDWPPPGYNRLRGRLPEEFIQFLRKAIQVNPRKRYRDADQMLNAFKRSKSQVLKEGGKRRRRKNGTVRGRDWKTVRRKQFLREFGKVLEARHSCTRCHGPVAESMQACPWCGAKREVHQGGTRFPISCPRCRRGLKLDWKFCPWCYGAGFETQTNREYSDVRYRAYCSNPKCTRKVLMPFMRYCPWCRRKVRRKWKIPGSKDACSSCGWGVLKAYWDFCPWCAKPLKRR